MLKDFVKQIVQKVEDGDSALQLTCLYGHLSCIQLLLEAKDEDCGIPLHDACVGVLTIEGGES
ncbi:putative ankyrin repeat-containing domain superfamily [Helianthus annuus]|nr:putative ankyrin repeat-containing domain superfamily [Helianthus annuus]KAJ0442828.1 putative ankyrin repeat-containing domain superfamily [Helianthus annuus]KAJ0460478.1 putative ankyrin repeat-containing domain superfamily [Helianthus annuus]